ncbi:glycoprotein 3-alpha-L-fucosyltransferase A-like [Mytilus trossulus]|uniref:glycoprotein 3-alpha-L-fucosyltransferase A-like n=1 Tax=Mytilus trossulus TaxID=6551 RepID=UPI0030065267
MSNKAMNYQIWSIIIMVSSLCAVWITLRPSMNVINKPISNSEQTRQHQFTILYYGAPSYHTKNKKNTDFFNGCEFQNCKIVFDRSVLNTSDIVLFEQTMLKDKMPKKRNKQTWVYETYETPYHTQTVDKHFQFDWTMSYRHDSDAFSPYGIIKLRSSTTEQNYTSIYSRKTHNVAWIVSNCHTVSKREAYVRQLSKYIDVDIYGRCGNFSIAGTPYESRKRLSEKYKFVLSFENSLCKDYMTEKIFSVYVADVNIIPIVRGAPNVGDYLPVNTYISTSDFTSPMKLARFLKKVGNSETSYISYLKEKDKYYTYSNPNDETGMCNLCRLINRGYQRRYTLNIHQWLWEGQCISPSDV